MPEHAPKLLLTNSFQLHRQMFLRGAAIPNMPTIFNPFDGWSPVLTPPSPPTTTTPPPRTHTHHLKKKRKKETPTRGSKGGCVAKMSAQMRKVGGGRGHCAPGEEYAFQLRTDSREAGLCEAEGPGGRGRGGAKMTTRSTERSLGICSRAVAFSPSPALSLLSHCTPSFGPPTPSPIQLPFFSELEKEKLTGALNLRAGGPLAGRAGRGDSGRRGVLPGEVRPPRGVDRGRGAAEAGDAGLTRSLRLARSPPAASLARPLRGSDSHYSLIPIWHPLCAHARHSFLRLLFCVCAQRTPSTTFSKCLRHVLSQLAGGTLRPFPYPRWDAPAPGLIATAPHTHTLTYKHPTFPLPLPVRLPSLFPFSSLHTRSAESSHHRRFRKSICREI